MKVLSTLILLAFFCHGPATAHDVCAEAECEKVKQKIKKIESKMRQGYSRAQGEKMSAQLRELRAVRTKICR